MKIINCREEIQFEIYVPLKGVVLQNNCNLTKLGQIEEIIQGSRLEVFCTKFLICR